VPLKVGHARFLNETEQALGAHHTMPHTQKTFLIGCTITLLAGVSGYGIYALFASCSDAVGTLEQEGNRTLSALGNLSHGALKKLEDTLTAGCSTCWQFDKVLTRIDRTLPEVHAQTKKLQASLTALNTSLKHPDILEEITLKTLLKPASELLTSLDKYSEQAWYYAASTNATQLALRIEKLCRTLHHDQKEIDSIKKKIKGDVRFSMQKAEQAMQPICTAAPWILGPALLILLTCTYLTLDVLAKTERILQQNNQVKPRLDERRSLLSRSPYTA
jgi:hypothetical protein